MALITRPNLTRPDDLYARLIAEHEGLSTEESAALNARLILILINHIGEEAVLDEALELAGRARRDEPPGGLDDRSVQEVEKVARPGGGT